MTRDELLKKICPWGTCDCGDDYESCNCDDCNRVLEEWLYDYEKHVIEQYKADTNLKDTIKDIHDNVAQEMYCKGIDEFARKLYKRCNEMIKQTWGSNTAPVSWAEAYANFKEDIDEIAEQLKAGVNNE